MEKPPSGFELSLLRILEEVILEIAIEPEVKRKDDEENRDRPPDSGSRIPPVISLEDVREVDIDVPKEEGTKANDEDVEKDDRKEMDKDIPGTGFSWFFHRERRGENVESTIARFR
jgi:hypothetical protein